MIMNAESVGHVCVCREAGSTQGCFHEHPAYHLCKVTIGLCLVSSLSHSHVFTAHSNHPLPSWQPPVSVITKKITVGDVASGKLLSPPGLHLTKKLAVEHLHRQLIQWLKMNLPLYPSSPWLGSARSPVHPVWSVQLLRSIPFPS